LQALQVEGDELHVKLRQLYPRWILLLVATAIAW